MLAGSTGLTSALRFADRPAAPSSSAGDLLGMDDLLGGLSGSAALSAPAPASPRLRLAPNPQMSPADFQRMWGALPPGLKFTHTLSTAALTDIQANSHQVCGVLRPSLASVPTLTTVAPAFPWDSSGTGHSKLGRPSAISFTLSNLHVP